LAEVYEFVRRTPPDERPPNALLALARAVPEPYRTEAVALILDTVRALGGGAATENAGHIRSPVADVLARVVDVLPATDRPALLQEAYEATRSLGDNQAAGGALAGLVPWLPRHALDLAWRLAVSLPGGRILGELGNGLDIGGLDGRGAAMCAVAGVVPAEGAARVISAAADAVAEPALRSALLSAVADRVPEVLLDGAIGLAQAIEPARLRARPLARLARHLADSACDDLQREAILGTRWTSPGGSPREPAGPAATPGSSSTPPASAPPEELEIILRSVAADLSTVVLAEAADLAREIPDAERRAWAQAALLTAARVDDRAGLAARIARDALATVADMNYPERALTRLATALPREFAAEAYAIARGVPTKFLRGSQPSAAALAAVIGLLDEADRRDSLRDIAANLPPEHTNLSRLDIVATVAERCTDPAVADLMAGVLRDADARTDGPRPAARLRLVSFLPPAEQVQIVADLAQVGVSGNHMSRAGYIRTIVPALAALPRPSATRLLGRLLHPPSPRPRQAMLWELRVLGPVLTAVGGPEAAAETRVAIADVRRWWP
jgi:hypothetical protein